MTFGSEAEKFRERGRGAVELPDARQDAAVLVGVGVAEHDVLLPAGIDDELEDAGQRIKFLHDRRGVAQILDRLKKRHDDEIGDDALSVARIERAAHQAAFLLQQQRFEKVADRFSVADDVMAYRFIAIEPSHLERAFHDRQFARGAVAVCRARQAHRPRIVEQPQQQLLLFVFRERGVIVDDAGDFEELGDRLLVPVGALPQIERRKVKAEDFDGADQRLEPLRGDDLAVMHAQRFIDRDEIGEQRP